jgi:hypothetical protein
MLELVRMRDRPRRVRGIEVHHRTTIGSLQPAGSCGSASMGSTLCGISRRSTWLPTKRPHRMPSWRRWSD